MVTITLYARQQKRHRCIEQSFGSGRGRGWDDLGEWHWNMYNIIYETSRQSRCDAQYWMLGAGALGRPRGMVCGGRREEPCPSPTPGVHSNSIPSSWWCHPAISSSVVPFSSHLQSFPASGSFQMSQVFALGGQNIEVSASTSVPPVNIQDSFPLEWTGWISLQSKGLSRVFSNTTVQKHQSSVLSLLHSPTLTFIHDHRKKHSLD